MSDDAAASRPSYFLGQKSVPVYLQHMDDQHLQLLPGKTFIMPVNTLLFTAIRWQRSEENLNTALK